MLRREELGRNWEGRKEFVREERKEERKDPGGKQPAGLGEGLFFFSQKLLPKFFFPFPTKEPIVVVVFLA